MQTGLSENRDLDLFFAMLQERARDIRTRTSSPRNIDFELFRNLPRDITLNILSRLPIQNIMECKVVCKAWRDLINSPEFGKSQSDRHRCLIVFPDTSAYFWLNDDRIYPRPYTINESNNSPMPILHIGLYKSVPLVRNSVNGLILLLRREWTEQQQHQRILLWVCNPITREYVRIPNPSYVDFNLGFPYPPEHRRPLFPFDSEHRYPGAPPEEYGNYNFGFGVSRKGKQYKVVWITQSECRVYTLGLGLGLGGATGQWRNIATSRPGLLRYNKWNTECAFVDGNLYWLDPPESQSQTDISCFDLETEVFSYFSAPSTRGDLHVDCYRSVCAFDDCLCLGDVYGNEIEIWLMTRGGEWSKKVAITEQGGVGRSVKFADGYFFPIKDGGDGMLLGSRCEDTILCHPNNKDRGGRRKIRWLYPVMQHSSGHEYPRAVVYTPSFLPLRSLLVDEDVQSF